MRESAAPLLKVLDGQLDSNGHQQRQMRRAAMTLDTRRKIHASYMPEHPDKRFEILKDNRLRLKPIVQQRAKYVNQTPKAPHLLEELKYKTLRKHLPNSPASKTQQSCNFEKSPKPKEMPMWEMLYRQRACSYQTETPSPSIRESSFSLILPDINTSHIIQK